jgi:ferric-dicitrate binding protein FerR (iron transport regulator)
MTIGDCLIEMPASKIEARNLRRQLLVWRERDAEHRKRFERLERQFRRRFGHDALPTEELPMPIRLAAFEQALESRISTGQKSRGPRASGLKGPI